MGLEAVVGLMGLMLLMGLLTIISVVLGVRSRGCQPKSRAAGWMPFTLQHPGVILLCDTVSSPQWCVLHMGYTPQQQSAEERGQSLQHWEVLLQMAIEWRPSALVVLTRAAQGLGCVPSLVPRFKDQRLNSCCLPWKAAEEPHFTSLVRLAVAYRYVYRASCV